MKVRAKQVWETLDVPVGGGGIVAVVRETPPAERQRIARACVKKEFSGGDIVEVPDTEKFLRALIRHYVADLRGVTVENLLALAPLAVGTEEELDLPEPGADGVIPYDPAHIVWRSPDTGTAHNLAEYLWIRAPQTEFAGLVEAVAKRLTAVKKAAEEAEKKSSSDS